ncbi:MAG: hypothetical protein OXS50_02990, partial [Gammaproteobacteria bacterium]|nr:hypothetical protein [Gammaproteobacteria bacterium]
MTPPLPEFAEFFHAAHGHAPTPWQMQLADRVAGERRWPEEFVVADGAGKLGCIDVAVWWLALEAARPAAERAAPTRIWWVDEEPGAQPSVAFGRDGARDFLPPKERALRRDGGRDALPPEERALGRGGGRDALPPEERALGRGGGRDALPPEERALGRDGGRDALPPEER